MVCGEIKGLFYFLFFPLCIKIQRRCSVRVYVFDVNYGVGGFLRYEHIINKLTKYIYVSLKQ
jgi:hypothetical protein